MPGYCQPKRPDVWHDSNFVAAPQRPCWPMPAVSLQHVGRSGSHAFSGGHRAAWSGNTKPTVRLPCAVLDGILLADDAQSADLREHYCPSLAIDSSGAALHRAWHMVRDQETQWPWYDERNEAARRIPANTDGMRLHRRMLDILMHREHYKDPVLASLECDVRNELSRLKYMDIRQLKYFLMIAEHRNYARAADELGLTQSALTQSMMRLEEELESRLFERGRFGAELTDVGDALLHRARLIIAEVRRAESEVKDMRGATRGSITVGISKSLASSYIARILVEYAKQRPDVSLTVNEGWSPNLFRDLARGEFDFVVSAPQPGVKIDPDLHLEPIAHQVEMPVISIRHPLAKKATPQISDLSDLMWGLPPKGNQRIRRLREIFQALGLQPPIHFLRTDSDTMALAMIKEGLIVGLANVDTLEREIRERSIIVLPFEELKIDRQIVIVKRRRSRLTPVAEVLFEQIKAGHAPPMLAAAQ